MPILSRIVAVAAFAVAVPAMSQTYPSRPVTLVVPFSAGGGVDIVARLLADKLAPVLKQPVVVENKAGGSGMIGAVAVVRAAPDGHTLLLGTAGETAINPFVFKGRMQYDPQKDLAPITLVTRIPNVLVANPKLPVKNIEELVAMAKAKEGRLTYSSSGVGNPQHLNGELLKQVAGVNWTHVPYKGAAGQLVDVTSGNVDFTFASYAAVRPFVQSGKVKALGVTSVKRATFAPDLPAIGESKAAKGYELENWFGLFAPAGTPPEVQQKINAVVTWALNDPELQKKLREQGGESAPMRIAQFRSFVRSESVRFGRIVESAKITSE